MGPALGGFVSHPCSIGSTSSFCAHGAIFSRYPYLLPCLIAAISAGLTALIAAFVLKETLLLTPPNSPRARLPNSPRARLPNSPSARLATPNTDTESSPAPAHARSVLALAAQLPGVRWGLARLLPARALLPAGADSERAGLLQTRGEKRSLLSDDAGGHLELTLIKADADEADADRSDPVDPRGRPVVVDIRAPCDRAPAWPGLLDEADANSSDSVSASGNEAGSGAANASGQLSESCGPGHTARAGPEPLDGAPRGSRQPAATQREPSRQLSDLPGVAKDGPGPGSAADDFWADSAERASPCAESPGACSGGALDETPWYKDRCELCAPVLHIWSRPAACYKRTELLRCYVHCECEPKRL